MMQLLRNSSKRITNEDRQPEQQGAKVTGLAATFDAGEVKKLFYSYLITILSIEGLILFLSYINLLATNSSLFPWKPYLFATFLAPIATTFIFGLILLTFNRFFFNESPPVVETRGLHSTGFGAGKGERVDFFFQTVHRLPFLFSMFLLIVATAFAYKLDVIIVYMAQVGASTARYLYFTLIGLLVVAALGIVIWMILSYRLRKSSLQGGHQYRMQLMEQFEMVLLDDGTMINKNGDIVYQQDGTAQLFHSESAEDLCVIEEVGEDEKG
ncbi:MAG: hypothetical protein U9R69_10190 [Thermodesulfobacteriota bacterium]|nr:hypothetical protein [Thermodesulfobacteriota bacterium]